MSDTLYLEAGFEEVGSISVMATRLFEDTAYEARKAAECETRQAQLRQGMTFDQWGNVEKSKRGAANAKAGRQAKRAA